MKFRTAISLILASAFFCAPAVAQNAPASEKNDKNDKNKEIAKMDSLAFVQTAADVANNLRHESLNNYLGIYIDAKNWPAGLKDGDLAPFLKSQPAKPDRSAACLFSAAKDTAVCVYFDGEKAYGAVAVHANASGKIEDKEVDAGYKIVTKELLEKSPAKLHFEQSDVATDEGVPLPAYQVTVMPLL
jgi:hypothetical protein